MPRESDERPQLNGDNIQWTPRQREVLDLLARRYSNAEVAEQLGITLNGAKWHVHEILDKLGVDTREDAAEYWRKRNGLGSRLGRMFTGIAAGIGLRAAGGAGALVIAAGAGVGVYAAWPEGNADEPPQATDAAATPTPSPTPGPTPTEAELQALEREIRASIDQSASKVGVSARIDERTIEVWPMSYHALGQDPRAAEDRLSSEFGVNVEIRVTDPGPIFPPDAPTGPLALYHNGPWSNAMATGGTLRITDECVYLEDSSGALSLLVFPFRETGWDVDSRTITFRGVEMQDGDTVSFGGGGIDLPPGGITGWPAPVDPSCDTDSAFQVGLK